MLQCCRWLDPESKIVKTRLLGGETISGSDLHNETANMETIGPTLSDRVETRSAWEELKASRVVRWF